ncbi:MAG: hypothetical protein HY722_02220 [Planctomycetes bacterium]|nr:hypothetical protein [Planctomycetota bacterium]
MGTGGEQQGGSAQATAAPEKTAIYLGSVLKDLGFVTAEQLLEVLDLQLREDKAKLRHRLLGEILKDRGYLSPGQLAQGLRRVEVLTFAELLRERDLMDPGELAALAEDPNTLSGGLRWFGDELVARGYLTRLQLDALLGRVEPAGIFLGDFLRANGLATADQILYCMDLQQKDRRAGRKPRPLGRLLVENGYLEQAQLDEALQFHISTVPQAAPTATGLPAAPVPTPTATPLTTPMTTPSGLPAAPVPAAPGRPVSVRVRVRYHDLPLAGVLDLGGAADLGSLLNAPTTRFVRLSGLSGPDGPVAWLNVAAIEAVRPD